MSEDLTRELGAMTRRAARLRAIVGQFAAEPLHPVSLADIAATRCPLCGTDELLLSGYPFTRSALLARALLVHCLACGLSWVPRVPFDLGQYYCRTYASSIQPFRKYRGNFQDPQNPFWSSAQATKYLERAETHIGLLNRFHPNLGSVLDYGAGVGVTLAKLQNVKKYACEIDVFSRAILEELGVELVDGFERSLSFDAIITSHSLEHGLVSELPGLLGWFHDVLKPGGILLVEVPRGFNLMSAIFETTGHGQHLQEPHTIFFSSWSLARFLQNAGFELMAVEICDWTEKKLAGEGAELFPNLAEIRLPGEQPLAVARRRGEAADG
jgi:predicted SAM-dependent methyltransferase